MSAGNNHKVLVVCQHFWPESFRINDTVDYLSKHRCSIDVLCGIPNYPKGKFYKGYSFFSNRRQKHNGVRIRRVLEIPRGNNSNFRILINYLSFPFFSLFHIPRLLFTKYDKIFLYSLSPVMMSFAGIVVGKIRNTETTMYVLDLWPENLFSVLNIKNSVARSLVTKASHWHYKNVDKLIVLTDQMRVKLLEVTGKNPDDIIVLPQACEKLYEQDIHDTALEKKFKDGFNLVYTGNISPAQSFQTMIDAAKIVKQSGVNDVRWIIVGDGMSKKWVEEQVAQEDLGDVFHFEGQKAVEDIPRYTGIADGLVGCLVKSNLLEATVPAKVLSYIAAGKPILLAMDGEARTLINDKIRCGYASPTEDSQKLAENILKVYNMTSKKREVLGTRARKYHFKHLERNIILNRLYRFMFD